MTDPTDPRVTPRRGKHPWIGSTQPSREEARAAIAALDAQPASDLIAQVARLICGGGQDEMIAAATPLGEPCDYPAWMLEQLTARSIYAIIRKAVLADAADALAAKDAEIARLYMLAKANNDYVKLLKGDIAQMIAWLRSQSDARLQKAEVKKDPYQIGRMNGYAHAADVFESSQHHAKLGTDHAHDDNLDARDAEIAPLVAALKLWVQYSDADEEDDRDLPLYNAALRATLTALEGTDHAHD